MKDSVKKILRKEIYFFKIIQYILSGFFYKICRVFTKIAALSGAMYQFLQWKFPFTRAPFSYDHEITLLRWSTNKEKELSWLDRGYNNLNFIRRFDAPIILELGCGNGFFAKKFYALVPKSKVYACDFDKKALKKAKVGKPQNVDFIYADITKNMPTTEGGITNVVWDACINFFSIEMQEKLIKQIAEKLDKKGGILSGSGVLASDQKMWKEYDHLFQSENDVKTMMSKYFKYVRTYKGQSDADENIIFFVATNADTLKDLC